MAKKDSLQYKKIVSRIETETTKKKYKKIHLVINPASGGDEPILNTVNNVFSKYDVDWDISITKKFGDATKFAHQAAEAGADLVAGYGGDGTQHEIVNGIYGTGATMGVLPGGTGNGFNAGLGLPKTLAESLEVICTSNQIAKVDVIKIGDKLCLSRLYVGIEPEDQTSRELKDKYGLFAYAVSAFQKKEKKPPVTYTIEIDGKKIEKIGKKLYVVNSASTGIEIPLGNSLPTDGILEVFLLDENIASYVAAAERVIDTKGSFKGVNFWSGKEISITTEPDQAIWVDGEYFGRTPVEMKVIHQAVDVVVPPKTVEKK